MATGVVNAGSGVVAKAQGLLKPSAPEMIIDGRWGRFTNEAYLAAPADVKLSIDTLLKGNGLSADALWESHSQAKASNSDAYQTSKAAARQYRAGIVTQQLESGPAVSAARPNSPAPLEVVYDAIRKAAAQTGEDESLLHKFMFVESRHRSNAVNGSSRGLGQVQPAAWKDASRIVALGPYASAVWDPYQNALATAAYVQINRKQLVRAGLPRVGVPELYLAHQQGAGGAIELWRAAQGLPARTKYVSASHLLGNPPPDGLGKTSDKGEFYRRWTTYVGKL